MEYLLEHIGLMPYSGVDFALLHLLIELLCPKRLFLHTLALGAAHVQTVITE